jgi:putative MFS transporter
MFLLAEWSISAVFLAEELPAGRRGFGFGLMSGSASAGAIACAGLTPLLLHSPIGWRGVYVVGAVPLLLIAIARRSLPETRLFGRVMAAGRRPVGLPLLRILRGPHRGRVLQLAVIWFLTYAFAQTAVTFWKEFALAERGLSDAEVGRILAIAALVSLPLAFALGKVMDLLGRRLTAVVVFVTAGISCVAAYSLHAQWALTLAMIGGVFGGGAMGTVLNAFTTELFPTEVRADAFAWSNNLLGRLGGVVAPAVVGPVAGVVGWSSAVLPTVLCAVAALVLILVLLPETGRVAFDDQDNKEEPHATLERAG